jgi:DNA transformation protein
MAILAAAGITTLDDLQALGAVEVYRRVKSADPRASLNLLWALEGALTGLPWQTVAREHRSSLLLALDEAGRFSPQVGAQGLRR